MRALVLRVNRDGPFTEEYNGPGASVWATVSHNPPLENGQYQVALSTLQRLMQSVDKTRSIDWNGEAEPRQ